MHASFFFHVSFLAYLRWPSCPRKRYEHGSTSLVLVSQTLSCTLSSTLSVCCRSLAWIRVALSLAHTLSRSPPSLRPVPPVPKPDLLARDAKVLGERHARTSARRELGHRFKELLEEKLLLAQDDPARRCHGRTAHPLGSRPFVVVLLAGLLVVRLVLAVESGARPLILELCRPLPKKERRADTCKN